MRSVDWRKLARAVARGLRGNKLVPSPREVIGQAPTAHILELYPEAQGVPVPLGDVEYRIFNMDPLERFCLGVISKIKQPATVFEIGTYDGATTLLLAKTAPTAQVFTLDLPREKYITPDRYGYPSPTTDPPPSGADIGSRFRDTPEACRIVQLHGDSRRFDFSEYYGRVDLVVVDARHDYDAVCVDSENALRMAGSNGVVVWDDYDIEWPGVVRAVDETTARHGERVTRIRQTGLVVRDPSRSVVVASPS